MAVTAEVIISRVIELKKTSLHICYQKVAATKLPHSDQYYTPVNDQISWIVGWNVRCWVCSSFFLLFFFLSGGDPVRLM